MNNPESIRYAAIIRAYEYTENIERVISSLRSQTVPPSQIIVVDSSSRRDLGVPLSKLDVTTVLFPKTTFNYSLALNVGIAENKHPYALPISSHLTINCAKLIERALDYASRKGIEVMYWANSSDPSSSSETFVEITRKGFDGRNGLSNSICLLPTGLVRNRPFREEVRSAEDQEWASYYLRNFELPILRIETNHIDYRNPNHGAGTWSEVKLLNEELSIGHFINRALISPPRIVARLLRGVLAAARGRPRRAKMHFRHGLAMMHANFYPPETNSRYFK